MKNKENIELVKLRKRITTRFHKACADYGLIEDGDKILVGLSGGKDSLALVELLGKRQKIFVPRFSVVAAHVIVEDIGYQSDTEYLEAFCKEHDVEFVCIYTQVESKKTKDNSRITNDAQHVRLSSFDFERSGLSTSKNHCLLCSWYRRKALFDLAKDLGCNKIALGHNKDDIVETLLMNLVYQGAFATNPPLLQMDKFPMKIVRPLCLIKEDDLREYARLREYKQMPKLCPFEHESSRAEVKNLIKELRKLNPEVLDSVWGAMENIKADYLPRRPQR